MEKLKVLILNGSPRTNGNIALALHEMRHRACCRRDL